MYIITRVSADMRDCFGLFRPNGGRKKEADNSPLLELLGFAAAKNGCSTPLSQKLSRVENEPEEYKLGGTSIKNSKVTLALDRARPL